MPIRPYFRTSEDRPVHLSHYFGIYAQVLKNRRLVSTVDIFHRSILWSSDAIPTPHVHLRSWPTLCCSGSLAISAAQTLRGWAIRDWRAYLTLTGPKTLTTDLCDQVAQTASVIGGANWDNQCLPLTSTSAAHLGRRVRSIKWDAGFNSPLI